eukprot:11538719-Karenia_brevis.AAC.1
MFWSHWQHEVREALRWATWKQAAARWSDMAGIQCGIDRPATLALLGSQMLNDCEKGILRAVLTGAMNTQVRLHKAGVVDGPCCPYCGTGEVEDVEHMWWHCPAWEQIRQKHRSVWFAFRNEWPQ